MVVVDDGSDDAFFYTNVFVVLMFVFVCVLWCFLCF